MKLSIGNGKRLDIGTWSYGLLADFIQGGASAVGAGFGAIAFDPKDFNFQTGKFYGLMGAVFLFQGFIKAMAYLAGHPLPAAITGTFEVHKKTEEHDAKTD